ncbi:uncharacterized protein LOC142164663 [Nicotiana tabacum]|uniref:Uncharacterized protein LOC142164663 n=1 Tax=Nicotiana tabacum TaxID=4097 RepID=A0AC58S208_TOBAC
MDNLTKAQNRMKQYADSKRSDRNFEVGDTVFLKLQPYRQTSVVICRNLNLVAKFYGSFEVLRRIGMVAYEIKPPLGSKIHPIFHVSQLKKAMGNHVQQSKEPPICTDDGQFLTEPVAILDRRIVKKGNKASTQVLVQWEILSKDEATWADYTFLTP